MARLAWLAVVMYSASAQAAECRLDGKAWIVGRAGGGAVGRVVDAKVGERVTAWVVAPGRLGGERVLFSDAPGSRFVSWERAGCGKWTVAWRRVEPTMLHTVTKAPNPDNATYSNAVIFGPRHGEWIDWDRIEYFATPLAGSAASITVGDARPSDPKLDGHGGLGVMRLAATIGGQGGPHAETPGERDFEGPNLSDGVFRYTYRSGDDFLGWLGTYFNVPYLFGSAGKGARAQAERYLGADCADVLVAALRRAGRRDLEYTSVAGLIGSARRVAGPVRIDPGDEDEAATGKTAGARLRWGRDVQPGDLLIIDYVGWTGSPRQWDHVLVAVADRGVDGDPPDGVLGPEDLVADSGDATGLLFTSLERQGKIDLVVVRIPEEKKVARRARSRSSDGG